MQHTQQHTKEDQVYGATIGVILLVFVIWFLGYMLSDFLEFKNRFHRFHHEESTFMRLGEYEQNLAELREILETGRDPNAWESFLSAADSNGMIWLVPVVGFIAATIVLIILIIHMHMLIDKWIEFRKAESNKRAAERYEQAARLAAESKLTCDRDATIRNVNAAMEAISDRNVKAAMEAIEAGN